MSSTVEAKSICIKHLEDVLIDPMFTIFHVQHKQIAERTDSDNKLMHHFKNSMANVKTWNATVVKDFCSSLPVRFPQLVEFERLFFELQDIMCNILNESSISNTYTPIREAVYSILHDFVSACSDAFIGNLEWFSVEESSSEFQLYKNNAKTVMQKTTMVENVVMNFIKASPKDEEINNDMSDSDGDSVGSGGSDSESDKEDDENKEEEKDDEDNVVKHIDLKSGSVSSDVIDENMIGKFSTFTRSESDKENDSESDKENDSESDKESDKENDSESDKENENDEEEKDDKKLKKEKKDSYVSESDSDESESDESESDDSESESDESGSDESDSESDESESDDSESDESESDESESDESESDESESDESESDSGSDDDSGRESGSSESENDSTDDESLNDSDSELDNMSVDSYQSESSSDSL